MQRNRQNAQNAKIFLDAYTNTIGTGVNLGFTDWELTSLHDIIEGIRASKDGIQLKVVDWKFVLRIYANNFFEVRPVIVQTAGAVSGQANLSTRIVDDMINSSIDDVFGWEHLTPQPLVAKRVPIDAGHQAPTHITGIEVTITLPARYRDILNKETETERLQELYVGICGHILSQVNVTHYIFHEIKYIETRKKIVLR